MREIEGRVTKIGGASPVYNFTFLKKISGVFFTSSLRTIGFRREGEDTVAVDNSIATSRENEELGYHFQINLYFLD